ncbi:hypothetical protein [Methanosarcina virus MetMV]|jgi:hypothetical protein|nr:hypothetical protein [Methanosarcina virus MetMV]AZF89981.1 hypothetical protein [Methanosarcina virus MetMV]
MNKFKVVFNYQGEISKMETEAETNYKAILKCLPVMAKKYGVKKESMIRYFTSDKLNCEAIETKRQSKEIKNGQNY